CGRRRRGAGRSSGSPDRRPEAHGRERHVEVHDAEGRQRVYGGVHDGGRNGDAPGLAQPLGAERVAGRGRMHLLERDGRHVGGARDRAVHQGAGQKLAVAIVHDRREQGPPEPRRCRAAARGRPPCRLTASGAAAARSFAAIRRPFSRTSAATRARAPPPSATLRLPKVPKPSGPERVSPWTTTTSSGVTPRWSATICAKVVSCPWPWALDPVIAVTRPERSTLMLPLSQPSAAGSMYEATPIPTISPWARRSACSRLSRV